MTLLKINTNKAPRAIGPYSQAIEAGNYVFCSGQIGLDAKSNKLILGGIKKETAQVLKNLQAILKEAGLTFNDVVRVDIFLTDLKNFAKVNEIYGEHFTGDPQPARQTVGVKVLPKNAQIEISLIAYKESEYGCNC